jgi:glucosylceramidase
MTSWHIRALFIATTVVAAGIVPVAAPTSARAAGGTEAVEVWVTTSNAQGPVIGLQRQPDVSFSPEPAQEQTRERERQAIRIDDTKRYQKWIGGGASFTDGAAWLINRKLSPALRDEVMRKLFDPREGIGVGFLRNPMGSSDLTRERYTYDDDPADRDDVSLPHFSIDHDRADVLPLTKQARALNPELALMMNAWSPPAWMKSNNDLVLGQILPKYYAHHAAYHVKTIEAYAAEGLPVDYVSLNNEPTCCPRLDYPSVLEMSGEEMRTMLKEAWLPAFAARKLSTKILLLDFNWGNQDLLVPLLRDPEILKSPYVGGVAWHGYGPDGGYIAQTVIHDHFGLDAFLTERSGFANDDKQQRRDMHDVIGVTRQWGRSLVKWPVASDEHSGPHIGGCPTCQGLVKVYTEGPRAGQVEYTIEYYTLGHLTKFVRRGAERIDSRAPREIMDVAFANPDGSLVLIAYNDGSTERPLSVSWRSKSFKYTLPAGASVTFKWGGPAH